ncbi:hypothetical protein MTR67_030009 [Solanum verrucosum]|uniref:Uncharacterized protein n=1 Tax=Solanum verrucosum TaxID=315347 RepID=A0AAF0TY53_SOLVR|nr:hypothetical protein MTR67_030009 [Solanum verrucosum]
MQNPTNSGLRDLNRIENFKTVSSITCEREFSLICSSLDLSLEPYISRDSYNKCFKGRGHEARRKPRDIGSKSHGTTGHSLMYIQLYNFITKKISKCNIKLSMILQVNFYK